MNDPFKDIVSFVQNTAGQLLNPQPKILSPLASKSTPMRVPARVPIQTGPPRDADINGRFRRGEISVEEADRLLNTDTPPPSTVNRVPTTIPPKQNVPAYGGIPGFVPAGNKTPNIPQEYVNIINNAARTNNINPALIAAHIQHESAGTWNPKIQGSTGDVGLGQIVLAMHPGISMEQASDPNFAIPWLANYLATSMRQFNDMNRTIASYNVGRGGANIHGPTPAGTGPLGQAYIDRVARNLSPELRKELGIITTYD